MIRLVTVAADVSTSPLTIPGILSGFFWFFLDLSVRGDTMVLDAGRVDRDTTQRRRNPMDRDSLHNRDSAAWKDGFLAGAKDGLSRANYGSSAAVQHDSDRLQYVFGYEAGYKAVWGEA
jgi:hypothetical protein